MHMKEKNLDTVTCSNISPPQGRPHHYVRFSLIATPFKRQCVRRVSYPTTEHHDTARAWAQTSRSGVQRIRSLLT